jgi:hypothetical protein
MLKGDPPVLCQRERFFPESLPTFGASLAHFPRLFFQRSTIVFLPARLALPPV